MAFADAQTGEGYRIYHDMHWCSARPSISGFVGQLELVLDKFCLCGGLRSCEGRALHPAYSIGRKNVRYTGKCVPAARLLQ